MQETQVQFLGWEDPLEKEMAAHSSILVWEIPWTEEPAGLYSPGGQKESNMIEVTQHEQEVKNLYSKKKQKTKNNLYSDTDERNCTNKEIIQYTKTLRWNKLKTTKTSGKVNHVYELEELILLKCHSPR